MHDNDLSPMEEAERIVHDEMSRHLDLVSGHLMQIPELFEGLAEQMTELVKKLEPLKRVLEEIVQHEASHIAQWEEQFDY